MDYATKHHIGHDQSAATGQTGQAVQAVGQLRKLDAATKRRSRNSERQTQIRSGFHAADGFLKCTFLPKLQTGQDIPSCKQPKGTERDFYRSLSLLAAYYGVEPMQSGGYGYPYSIAIALWDAQKQLKPVLNWDCLRLVRENGRAYLVSEERYNTGTALYYIPVVPLLTMLHDRKRRQAAQLLLSVCSYLYHIADIPYYRQENSYLYWMYEMLKDWIEQDGDDDEMEVYRSEFRIAEQVGDRIESKLFNRSNLNFFGQRLSRFTVRDGFDEDCRKVACEAYALYVKYPDRTIFANGSPYGAAAPDGDCDEETIGMEKYISFIADTRGWLYESLSDSINHEFNEYATMEEPTISRAFDGSPIAATNLDFESRLFELLHQLCDLFYDYNNIRK